MQQHAKTTWLPLHNAAGLYWMCYTHAVRQLHAVAPTHDMAACVDCMPEHGIANRPCYAVTKKPAHIAPLNKEQHTGQVLPGYAVRKKEVADLHKLVGNRLMLLGDPLGVDKLGKGPQHMVGNCHRQHFVLNTHRSGVRVATFSALPKWCQKSL